MAVRLELALPFRRGVSATSFQTGIAVGIAIGVAIGIESRGPGFRLNSIAIAMPIPTTMVCNRAIAPLCGAGQSHAFQAWPTTLAPLTGRLLPLTLIWHLLPGGTQHEYGDSAGQQPVFHIAEPGALDDLLQLSGGRKRLNAARQICISALIT